MIPKMYHFKNKMTKQEQIMQLIKQVAKLRDQEGKLLAQIYNLLKVDK